MRKKSIKKEIGEHIIKQYKADEGVYVDYTPLNVYMDSLDMVELTMWVEKRFKINIPVEYDTWERWRYLNNVVRFVDKELEGKV